MVTLGRMGGASNVLVDVEALGAELVETDRGGDVTYHGPGQLVGYPILTVPGVRGGGMADTAAYVAGVEQLLIDVLADLGLAAGRVDRLTGVWLDPRGPRPRKVAAIGVRLSRMRTMHGFALNVDTDLGWFDRIVPCGISDKRVTSLAEEGVDTSMAEVVDLVVAHASRRWAAHGRIDRAGVAFRVPTTDLAPFTRGEGAGTPVGRNGVGYGERADGTSVRLLGRLAEAGVGTVDPVPLKARKPTWMKVPLDTGPTYRQIRSTLRDLDLVTVCEEAGCPNISECWNDGTATFMILGDRCTRACGFCLVDTRKPGAVDHDEPGRVAEAVARMGLQHVVVTMVARDDLDDGGAAAIAATVHAIRDRNPAARVETLISDLRGDVESLETVFSARPDVLNHNIETVVRLQRAVRPSASYARSSGGSGPGRRCRAHHQVVDHRRHGRDQRRGRADAGRPARGRYRDRYHRPVSTSDLEPSSGGPMVGADRIRRMEASRRGHGHRPRRVVAVDSVQLPRPGSGGHRRCIQARRRRPARRAVVAHQPRVRQPMRRNMASPKSAGQRSTIARGTPRNNEPIWPHRPQRLDQVRWVDERTSPSLTRMFAERLDRARQLMTEQGVDTLLLSVGADLPYFCGYEAMPLERLTMLVVPRDAAATLVVPELEAPRVVERSEVFSIRPWGETEDPVALVAELAGRPQVVGVGDQTWARFVIDLVARMPSTTFRRATDVTGPIRSVKDPAEIEMLRTAGAAVDRIAARLQNGEIELAGRTEAEVSADLGRQILAEGHQRVNFAIVAAGAHAASPHHEAGDRVIEPGEGVLCDFGGTWMDDDGVGYCSDITRCVWLGQPPREFVELYEVLHEAQSASVAAATIGTPAEEVDRVGRAIISSAGMGQYFIHRTGHGIGVEAHEDPYIVEGNETPLVAGNAFSIEPGIYVPGRWGARLEDILVAADAGPDSMNRADHGLAVIDV